ncbi:MAG: hypothetical protein ACI4VJ_02390, partial [Methanosphaera sp.]
MNITRKHISIMILIFTVLILLTSVNANDVNNTTSLKSNTIHESNNGSHMETNITLESNNSQSITKNTQTTTKKLKQESTEGYVYTNSKGTGDGSDSTKPTNITNALTKVTNRGTVYLVTDDDNDTYYYKNTLNINSNTVTANVKNFNIT